MNTYLVIKRSWRSFTIWKSIICWISKTRCGGGGRSDRKWQFFKKIIIYLDWRIQYFCEVEKGPKEDLLRELRSLGCTCSFICCTRFTPIRFIDLCDGALAIWSNLFRRRWRCYSNTARSEHGSWWYFFPLRAYCDRRGSLKRSHLSFAAMWAFSSSWLPPWFFNFETGRLWWRTSSRDKWTKNADF